MFSMFHCLLLIIVGFFLFINIFKLEKMHIKVQLLSEFFIIQFIRYDVILYF